MAEKQYVATQALFVGTARAHNPGDPVPADNVERNGWQDGVAVVGTKAAERANEGEQTTVLAEIPGATPASVQQTPR